MFKASQKGNVKFSCAAVSGQEVVERLFCLLLVPDSAFLHACILHSQQRRVQPSLSIVSAHAVCF